MNQRDRRNLQLVIDQINILLLKNPNESFRTVTPTELSQYATQVSISLRALRAVLYDMVFENHPDSTPDELEESLKQLRLLNFSDPNVPKQHDEPE